MTEKTMGIHTNENARVLNFAPDIEKERDGWKRGVDNLTTLSTDIWASDQGIFVSSIC